MFSNNHLIIFATYRMKKLSQDYSFISEKVESGGLGAWGRLIYHVVIQDLLSWKRGKGAI